MKLLKKPIYCTRNAASIYPVDMLMLRNGAANTQVPTRAKYIPFRCGYKRAQLSAAVLVAFSLPFALASLTVNADVDDPLQMIFGLSRELDSNVFRIADDALPGSAGRGDSITKTYAGLKIDKQISQQRLKLDYTVTAHRYESYSLLDFNASEYNATWLWVLTPSLTGTISVDRSQAQYGFTDYTNYASLNVNTIDNRHVDADWSPYGNWHVLAGFTRSSNTSTQNFQAAQSFKQDAENIGLRYVFPSGSAMTAEGYSRQGDNEGSPLDPIQLYGDGFKEREAKLNLAWKLSAKSNLNLSTGYVSREHNHFSERDYSGFAGRAEYTWLPTDKLRLVLLATRDLASFQTYNSNYTRLDALTIAPMYAITPKVTLRASAGISERTFLAGDIIPTGGRVDTGKQVSIGIEWTPTRNVTVGGNLQYSCRSSTFPGLDFTDSIAGVTANFVF